MLDKKLLRAMAAEFIATLLFLFIVFGEVIYRVVPMSDTGSQNPPVPATLMVATTFGGSIASLVAATAQISGGHLNPIVSIAMLIYGELNAMECLLYIVSQCLGGLAGCGLLKLSSLNLYSLQGDPLAQVVNTVKQSNFYAGSFLLETVLSFLLVFVISLSALHNNDPYAPLAIGLAVALAHLVSGNITGTGINPARSLAPALMTLTFDNLELFIFAPILGGILAALVGRFVFGIQSSKTMYEPLLPQEVRDSLSVTNSTLPHQNLEEVTIALSDASPASSSTRHSLRKRTLSQDATESSMEENTVDAYKLQSTPVLMKSPVAVL